MKRKKNGGTPSNDIGGSLVDCPDCGCPNRPSDKFCIYCKTELVNREATLKEIAEYYLNYLYFRFKLRRLAPALATLSRSFFGTAIAASLLAGGAYLLYAAMNGAGFLYLCLGLLLALYGGSALYNILIKKEF